MERKETHNGKLIAEVVDHYHRDLFGFAQALPSYFSRLRKGDDVSEKKLRAIRLGVLFAQGDYQLCLKESKALYTFFKTIGDREYEGISQHQMAQAICYLGEPEKSMGLLIECMELSTSITFPEYRGMVEHSLSDTFNKLGLYDQSLTLLYNLLSKAKERGDHNGVFIVSCDIAAIFLEMGRYEDCKRQLLELNILTESEGLLNPFKLRLWREWAEYFLKTKQADQAHAIYLKHFSDDELFPNIKAYAALLNARCLAALKKYKEAESAANQALKFNKSNNYNVNLTLSYEVLVQILINQDKLKEAEAALKAMKKDTPASHGKKSALRYERLSAEFYEKSKHASKAMLHYKNCLMIEQSMQRSEGEIRLKALYLLSQEEWKNKELNAIKNQLLMKRDELEVSTIYIKQHQAMLTELDSFMKELREDNKRKKNIFREVHNKIKTLQLYDSDKKQIEDKINSEQQQYIVQIKTKYPALSNTEARVCSLLRSGLTSKEIAALLIIDVHTVEQHRYRIRKKIGITKTDDLMVILNQI